MQALAEGESAVGRPRKSPLRLATGGELSFPAGREGRLFTWLEAEEERRVAVVAPATARAIAAYLRARRYHRLADSPFVWLGLRNSGPLDGMGLYRMLRRRAEQADYEPAVHPHMSGDSA